MKYSYLASSEAHTKYVYAKSQYMVEKCKWE